MEVFLIILIIEGILGIIYVTNYNKLQYLKTKIEQSEELIDETLRERYDLLIKADDIIKKVLDGNKDYLKEYTSIKTDTLSSFEMDRKLKSAFNLLDNLKSDYKEIENNKDLKEIFANIKETNEKITATTAYYNKNTTKLNEYIRKFPSNIVAKICKIHIRPFFDGKDMTDDNYKDFKL